MSPPFLKKSKAHGEIWRSRQKNLKHHFSFLIISLLWPACINEFLHVMITPAIMFISFCLLKWITTPYFWKVGFFFVSPKHLVSAIFDFLLQKLQLHFEQNLALPSLSLFSAVYTVMLSSLLRFFITSIMSCDYVCHECHCVIVHVTSPKAPVVVVFQFLV